MPLLSGVCVWQVSLDQRPAQIQKLSGLLSPEELLRAMAYASEADRSRYVILHATLRTILAQILRLPPQTIVISRDRFGKPFTNDHPDLNFSISRSDDIGLIAVSRSTVVGIDVEKELPCPECVEIANSRFSEKEAALIRSAHQDEREKLFYRLWTCKEACAKADGRGLRIPLKDLEITLSDNPPAEGKSCVKSFVTGIPFEIYEFIPQAGYTATLATQACQDSQTHIIP